jgi:hypothetical protein
LVGKENDLFIRLDTDEQGKPKKATFLREMPEGPAVLICTYLSVPLHIPDNHIGECVGCGSAIQHRPVRDDVVKVCMVCAPSWVEGANNPQ